MYTINTNPAVGYWASGNKFSHLSFNEFISQSAGAKLSPATKAESAGQTMPTLADFVQVGHWQWVALCS